MPFVGSGEIAFTPVPNWQQLPDDVQLVEAIGVAADSSDNVYVFNRADPPIIVFDSEGRYLNSWGEGLFVRPHGIWIGQSDTLYLTDDQGHSVRQFSADGELIRTIGPSGQPSETGIQGMDYRQIRRPAGPFNMPTNTAVAPNGHIYVADGYGNARIHHFTPDGQLAASWGSPGDGSEQFNIPHGLGVGPDGRLYVADRENSRIQIFSAEGEFITVWTDVIRPTQVFVGRDGLVYVSELGKRAGLFPFHQRSPDAVGARVSIFGQEGNLLCRWGGGLNPSSPSDFYAAHDIWVDSQGSIYVGEVSLSAAAADGVDPRQLPTLRKFARHR